MQSRTEKYESSNNNTYSRSRKNTKLYEEIYDDMYKDITYSNMEVIDTAKQINIGKLKDMLDDKYDTRQYRTLKKYPKEDFDIYEKPLNEGKVKRSYDINKILTDAKNKRSFIEEAREKQKSLDYKIEEKKQNEYEELKKEEKELEELINTITIKPTENEKTDTESALDVLSELKGDENTIVTNPIESDFEINNKEKTSTEDIANDLEKTLVRADKTFYTDSNMFTKNDFEDFSDFENHKRKKSKIKVFIIILLILAILVVAGLFVYFYVLKK